MNIRESGRYFSETFDCILKKHNAYGESELPEVVRKEFFKTVKQERKDFNSLVYRLAKELSCPRLKEFVNGFYTERILGDFYRNMLRLKHISLEDLKDNSDGGTLFLF